MDRYDKIGYAYKFFVGLRGSLDIELDNGRGKKIFSLNTRTRRLIIKKGNLEKYKKLQK